MISTMDEVVAALPAAQVLNLNFATQNTKGTGNYHSLWKQLWGSGGTLVPNPPAGSGEAPTSQTLGAQRFTNAGGGQAVYLGRSRVSSTVINTYFLMDRLVHNSGLSGTDATEQVVNSADLTRYTTGVGVQLAIEWYTATGSTLRDVTVKYVNQAGTADRTTTVSFVTSPVIGQMLMIPLADGDTGIRQVQSVQLSGTTGTVGNFGITLFRYLNDFPISVANGSRFMDAIAGGFPLIQNNAALSFYVYAGSSSTGTVSASLHLISG
jgi:hypothetical protein